MNARDTASGVMTSTSTMYGPTAINEARCMPWRNRRRVIHLAVLADHRQRVAELPIGGRNWPFQRAIH
jgi:hypothetical protein